MSSVKAASPSVSIVFLVGADPAALGLVSSLSRSGGNATGVYMLTAALIGKRLQLLHEMVPHATTMAMLVKPTLFAVKTIDTEVGAAAAAAFLQQPARAAGGFGDALCTAGHLRWRALAKRGGLMSYGADLVGPLRQQGVYVARILKGIRPADLPILQPTRIELVIKPQDGAGPGLEHSAVAVAACRRGNRMIDRCHLANARALSWLGSSIIARAQPTPPW